MSLFWSAQFHWLQVENLFRNIHVISTGASQHIPTLFQLFHLGQEDII